MSREFKVLESKGFDKHLIAMHDKTREQIDDVFEKWYFDTYTVKRQTTSKSSLYMTVCTSKNSHVHKYNIFSGAFIRKTSLRPAHTFLDPEGIS